MNYMAETATAGEIIVGEAGFSWLYLALGMLPFWLGLLVVYLGFELVIRGYIQKYVPSWISDYGFLALVAIGLWRYLTMALPWVYTEIAVTNRRVVYRHGFLTRQVEEVAINRIEGVNMTQPLLGRLFGFGSLVVIGIGMDAIKLPPIADPMAFRRAIQEAISESKSTDAAFNS